MFHIRSASGHGCYFDNIFIGCMIYADGFFYCYLDHCVTYRQYGGIVVKNWKKIDMKLNVMKLQVPGR